VSFGSGRESLGDCWGAAKIAEVDSATQSSSERIGFIEKCPLLDNERKRRRFSETRLKFVQTKSLENFADASEAMCPYHGLNDSFSTGITGGIDWHKKRGTLAPRKNVTD
jgi:hypothetical protein